MVSLITVPSLPHHILNHLIAPQLLFNTLGAVLVGWLPPVDMPSVKKITMGPAYGQSAYFEDYDVVTMTLTQNVVPFLSYKPQKDENGKPLVPSHITNKVVASVMDTYFTIRDAGGVSGTKFQ